MPPNRIVVIGASAGGFSALRRIFSEIDSSISAAIFAVLHTTPDSRSLASALGSSSKLPVRNAAAGPIEAGNIYIAPPNCHLMLERGAIRLSQGPRENMHRPSIDVLFRSAAFAYRSKVIGVVLSGMLDDGTAGLFQIKRYGGVAVVQDPNDAEFDSMPLNACAHVKVDHLVPLARIAPLLNRLAGEQLRPAANPSQSNSSIQEDMISQDLKSGRATSYTCPECGGPLLEVREEKLTRFRCRLGHAYGPASLSFAHVEKTELALWSAYQLLTGEAELDGELERSSREQGEEAKAQQYRERSHKLQRAIELVHEAIDICSIDEGAN